MSGIVPVTVQNRPPIRSAIFRFEYCHRPGGRTLRGDPVGEAYFDSRGNRYVEHFWLLPNRTHIFVRSQRFGEVLEETRSDRRPDPMHIIDSDGVLRSIYIVTLSDTIASRRWTPLSCSCESSKPCKHMLAVELVRDRRDSSLRSLPSNLRETVLQSSRPPPLKF